MQWKSPESYAKSEKMVLFYQLKYSKRKLARNRASLHQSYFKSQFQAFANVFR